MLGLAGALALPFLFLPPAWRAAAAAALIAGAIPLAAIPIAASALGEILRSRSLGKRAATAAAVGSVCLGAGLALGRNPLLASILGGILTLALHAWVPAGIPSGATRAWSLSVLVLVTAAALVLDWRKIWIRL